MHVSDEELQHMTLMDAAQTNYQLYKQIAGTKAVPESVWFDSSEDELRETISGNARNPEDFYVDVFGGAM